MKPLWDIEGSYGKGKNDKMGAAKNTRTKEIIAIAKIVCCDVCGEELTGTPCCVHLER